MIEELPIGVLQFGSGKFLRCFVDLFLHELAERGQPSSRAVVVQSTGTHRVEQLHKRALHYTIAVRGIEGRQEVDRTVTVESVGDAVSALDDWPRVLEYAQSPAVGVIVSNVTEAGYRLAVDDHPRALPPGSFPAKLLAVLLARFEAGLPGVVILPCELIGRNAERLRQLVLEQADRWGLRDELLDYVAHRCRWCNTLVDRIVATPPEDHPLADDPLAAVCEPFAAWYIEDKSPNQAAAGAPDAAPTGERPGTAGPAVLDSLCAHAAVHRVVDIDSYSLRKVRILNGAHTALVAHALPRGFETVRRAVEDAEIRAWLVGLLHEEIIPTIADRVDEPEEFAAWVLERFANPFIEHRLADIALHHETKLQTRLLPTYHEFRERFHRVPERLHALVGNPTDN